ncbi:MAG: hypothetical protein ACMG6S_31490, partial [Byssovorax sp.]
ECAGHTGAVVELAESVTRDGRLSVTMRFDRLRTFLDGGRYLNPWEECSRDAGGDEAKATQLMSDRQGPAWYGKRVLFEGSFVHGKKFRYGALYTGGRALIPSYGPFCAVFSMAAAQLWTLIAWLPANSLPRYVPDDHTFKVDQLTREVGAHGSRHHVAAIKHAGDAAACPRDEWPTMLCQGDRFIEGIVADDLLPKQVERLLADGGTWKEMLRSNAALLAGSATAEQKTKASQYSALKKLMNARNMTIAWEQV